MRSDTAIKTASDSTAPTTAVTGPPPQDFDFRTRVIGGSRSPLCSSESVVSSGRVDPAIENRYDINSVICQQIVNRKWESSR
jgi:hypothetical protein